MNPTLRRPALLLLLAALTLRPSIALAEPSFAQRENARALVNEGRARLAAKDYEGARKAFKAAHDILGTPATGLDLAKAQEALGLLIEARSTALDVTRIPKKPSEPKASAEAREAAAALAEQLAERIPAVVISVKGIDAKTTPTVTVDNEPLNVLLLTLPRKINPGAHTIVASAHGYSTKRRNVNVKEGETVPVDLVLTRSGAGKSAASEPPPEPKDTAAPETAPAPVKDGEPEPSAEKTGKALRLTGYVIGGAGILSVGVGAIFGGIAISRNNASKEDNRCDDENLCTAYGKDLRIGSFRAARISTAAFVIGGAALAGGAVLLWAAPSKRSGASVALGPGSVWLTGRW